MKYIILFVFSMSFQMSYGETSLEQAEERQQKMCEYHGSVKRRDFAMRLKEEGCIKGDIISFGSSFFIENYCDFEYSIVFDNFQNSTVHCVYIGYYREDVLIKKKKKKKKK